MNDLFVDVLLKRPEQKQLGIQDKDREALKMVKRGAPFNAIPVELERKQLTLVVPVAFKLSAN